MKTDPRETAFVDSFIFPEQIGPHKLRPIGTMSLTLLRRTGNRLIGGQKIDPSKAMEDPAVLQALQEFIFLHAAPVPEAIRASRLPREEFEDVVLAFCGDISLEDLLHARKSFDRQTAGAEHVMVDPAPPTGREDTRDPNASSRSGSRAGSGRSAARRAGRKTS